jgi:allantoicase
LSDFLDLPDLAAEGLGGAALLANDEFFAEKENLLKPHEAEWRDHVYTDRGKWMDGWETRRRREPGHDWCVVRLGLPGAVRGVVVDTKWFRGNFPAEAALDGAALDGPLDLAELEGARWIELVPRSPLQGDTRNLFPVTHGGRVTHVRLRIFPDGGVARLRVHGEVLPDWPRLVRLGGPIDLAALEHGAVVVSCSDMFFGSRSNLIKPGRAVDMSDGWETRRRRGPGNDWAIVKLAAPGTVRRAEIDTTHFKGNAPGRCTLELARVAGPPDGAAWRPVLASPLQPHTRHVFDEGLRRVGVATHARLSVFPDGGVARLRLWGEPERRPDPGLARLNELAAGEAAAALHAVCGARAWVERMVAARPFEDVAQLVRAGERSWWSLGEADWLEAFAAHPKIGQRETSARWSADEQSGVRAAGADVLDELAAANRAYEERNGFIFIVCATGKSAPEMLELLRARLATGRGEELRTAAEEQAQIVELRLRKLVSA